jgi:hypothetical protein
MSERGEISRLKGARATKNSGRGKIQKGDSFWGRFTVDVKEFTNSFSLSRAVWAKICTDSLKNKGTDPMLLVVLDGQTRLAVIELAVLEELLENQNDAV